MPLAALAHVFARPGAGLTPSGTRFIEAEGEIGYRFDVPLPANAGLLRAVPVAGGPSRTSPIHRRAFLPKMW